MLSGQAQFRLLIGSLVFGSLLLSGCEFVDDQRKASPERAEIANPRPLIANARAQNERHRVLVAVIDTGVDYLHPELQKNIHLQLDPQGNPLRWGWDYLGEDGWPAPLLVRTVDINPDVGDRDHRQSEFMGKMYEDGLRLVPELSRFINPVRIADTEARMFHGTHVAGLMTYDRDDIGLLAYRVMPMNRKEGRGLISDPEDKKNKWPSFGKASRQYADAMAEYRKESLQNLERAFHQAIADGATVINLSLGLSPALSCLKEGFQSPKCEATDREFYQKMQKLITSAENVVFVAAAGNDGKSFDGAEVLPCGFEADNLICVGALKNEKTVAEFSNIALKHKNFVFAPGVQILSLMPTSICHSALIPGASKVGTYDRDDEPTRLQMWEEVLKQCSAETGYGPVSGTSMATPLIARQIALLKADAPAKKGSEIVREFFARTLSVEVQGTPYRRFDVEAPSWTKGKGLYLPIKAGGKGTIPFFLPNVHSI
ncbi:MAG: S8 family serine peptidase [Bdellovibrionaceae bacterium]|nr:S8 family serine peptidase [Pseudobdellovibrionaceae bacterium]